MMCSSGINGEGELMGQLANTGSAGKMAVKTECVCVSPKRPNEYLLNYMNCLQQLFSVCF